MTTSSMRQVIVAMIVAVSAATVHGAWFSTTDATSEAAGVASIRLSQWDHYQQKWLATIVAPNETLRASEGAIIELRPTASGEQASLSGVNWEPLTVVGNKLSDVNGDLNIPVLTEGENGNSIFAGTEVPAPPAAGTATYIRLSVSTLSHVSEPRPTELGPNDAWAGPTDPTPDDLSATDVGGSVGLNPVTITAGSDSVSFMWDVSRWAKGDVFLGVGTTVFKVITRDGNFKRFIATADYMDLRHEDYLLTTGCTANWKTGEIFATNFGEGFPSVNVFTRHPNSSLDPLVQYSPVDRRISTRVERPDDPDSYYGLEHAPESVVFDGDLNLYVGHSFGSFSMAPDAWNDDPTKFFEGLDEDGGYGEYTTDINGLPLENWTWDEGWGSVVDENGVRVLIAPFGTQNPADFYTPIYGVQLSYRMNYTGGQLDMAPVLNPLGLPDWPSVLPTGYWSDPATGVPMEKAGAPNTKIPYRWSMGKRLQRYNNTDNAGVYSPSDRDAFWTFTGRQGTDWIDLDVSGEVMYYTSEDSFIHRYNVRTGQQLPDVGAVDEEGNPRDSKLVAGDYRFHALRILPPGDGTGGFLVATQFGINRFTSDGRLVQQYQIHDDPDAGGAVQEWYTLEVDPAGRSFWVSAHDTGWIYQFDIATGRVLNRLESIKYRAQYTNGNEDPGQYVRGICIMWEYTAPQEVCFKPDGSADGVDNDGDGFIDENCHSIEICSALSPGDDDGDNLPDQFDPDCAAELPPLAIDDEYRMRQKEFTPTTTLVVPATDGVLKRGDDDRDRDADQSTLTVIAAGTNEGALDPLGAAVTTAKGGSVTILPDGSFEYTPDPEFHGIDTFAYRITDGYPEDGPERDIPSDPAQDDIATVTIIVEPKVADDGVYQVLVGQTVSRSGTDADGLLANDAQYPGDAGADGPVTIVGAWDPLMGPKVDLASGTRTFMTNDGNRVTVNADGSFDFEALNLAFSGVDTFNYDVHDTVSRSWNIATVSVNVNRPTVTVTVPDQTKTYDGTPLPTTCTVTSNASPGPYAFTMSYTGTSRGGVAYGPSETAPTNAGTYTATCVYDEPVLGPQTDTGTITILPRPLTARANDKTITLGSPLPTLDGTLTGDVVAGDVITVTYASTNPGTAAGVFPGVLVPTATAEGSTVFANYVVTEIAGTLTVTSKSINVVAEPVCIADTPYVNFTVSATNFTPEVGEDIILRWKDSSGAVVLTQTFVWTNVSAPFTQQVLWPGAVVDGNGTVTDWPGWIFNGTEWVQGNDGFQLTRPTSTVEIEVNPTMSLQVSYPPPTPNCNAAPPRTPTIVATGGVFPYDGQPHAATCRVTGADGESLPGVLTYDDFGPNAPVNVGTYPATCTFAGNADYVPMTATTTVRITPIPLVVKAHDKTIYVGDPIPTLDGVWTGFLAGESVAAVYTTTAANSDATGTFPITPNPETSPVLGNYTLTVIPGTLTILPRVTTCSATGYVTYSQGGWGSNPNGGNPGALLAANFATVYGTGGARIGGTYKLTFTSAAAIAAYLPAGGSAKVLTSSQTNPTSSEGVLSAQLLALQLAADFSRAGVLQSGLGDMVMQSGPLAGQSVDTILAMANTVFGGNTSALPSGMSLSSLSSLLESIIMNYHEGADGGLLGCPSSPPVCTVTPPTAGRALVRRDATFDGRLEGSLQLMQAVNVTMNSTAVVTGQLLLPGVPQKIFNGGTSVTVANGTGTATPTSHTFIFNSGATLGSLVQRTAAVDLPVVATPPASSGTRNVTLNTPAGAIGDPATLRDLTLNSNVGPIAVPAGTYRTFIANHNTAFVLGVAGATEPAVYNFQTLTLNSGSRLEIVGPVVITVKNSLSANGAINPSEKPEWLTLRVSNGDFTLNSGVPFYGYAEVPNGRVTVNDGARLVGGLTADKLTNNSGGLVQLIGSPGRDCDDDNPTPVALVVKIDDKVKTYGDEDPALTYQITSGGPVDSGVLSGAISRVSGEPVGEYVIGAGTLAATSDYTLTVIPGTLTVLPRPAVVTAGTGTKVYGTTDPALTAVTTSGFLAADLPSITRNQSRASGETVGSYATTPTASGAVLSNYTVTYVNAVFTITPKPLTIVANDKTKVQGQPNPTLDGTITGVISGDGITAAYSTAANTASPVGTYPIVPSAVDPNSRLSNYTVSIVNGTLTVTAPEPVCAVSNTLTMDQSSSSGSAGNVRTFTQGGVTVKVAAFSRSKSSNTWATAFVGAFGTAGLGVTDNSENGSGTSHTIDNNGLNNYLVFVFSEPVAVTRAYLGYVSGDSDAQFWVGTLSAAFTSMPMFNDTLLNSLGGVQTSTGGSSARWATFNSGNATGNVLVVAAKTDETNDYFKVAKLDFTSCAQAPSALVVKIDDKTKIYGAPDPALTYQITSGGPVDSDVFSGTVARVSGEAVGEYVIGAGTLAATSNYTLTVVPGKLTVLPRPAVVTAGSGTKVYGTADPALTAVTTSGFLTADLPSITRNQSRASGQNVGSYLTTPTASGAVLSNYTVTYVNAAFTITPAPLTAVANNKTKTQGTANPTLDGTVTGVVSGDTITASYATTATTSSAVGSYPITVTLADPGNKLGNYNVTKTDGTLTVTAAEPVCSVSNIITMNESSSSTGTHGNVRTFTQSGVTVKVAAFSRVKDSNSWAKAFVGAFGTAGLGVTDSTENGSGTTHTLDNNGRNNYLVFVFSEPVVVTRAYLGYVSGDSDAQFWVGTMSGAFSSIPMFNDAVLASLGSAQSSTGGSSARWASFNSTNVTGNVLVVAAKTNETNDYFKVAKLDFNSCATAPPPPPPSTGSGVCSGGVTKLVLKYIGSGSPNGVVRGQRSSPGTGPIVNAQLSGTSTVLYTFATTDMGGVFSSVSGGRLANNFTVFIGNTEIADVHTSCSVPIYPGMKIGNLFEIVEVWTRGGGKM